MSEWYLKGIAMWSGRIWEFGSVINWHESHTIQDFVYETDFHGLTPGFQSWQVEHTKTIVIVHTIPSLCAHLCSKPLNRLQSHWVFIHTLRYSTLGCCSAFHDNFSIKARIPWKLFDLCIQIINCYQAICYANDIFPLNPCFTSKLGYHGNHCCTQGCYILTCKWAPHLCIPY